MDAPVICVRGLGKSYHLGGARGAPYQTLREAVSGATAAAARRLKQRRARPSFWALRDVSFDVQRGEAVGIIGRNGAGKSTLLKVLAKITLPTEGRAELRGRVGALLEVGSGFHPELTGRENIFLNGAILGMPRRQIARQLDEIIAFSEIERFIDTPVKRYSTGMHLRLAFAVAAHLEPEILVVDEVLAVGDASFQKKCLGRMEEVATHGRTVLFVSHNMPAVARLCSRAVVLDGGRVIADGAAQEMVALYLSGDAGGSGSRVWDLAEAPGKDGFALTSVEVIAPSGEARAVVDVGEPLRVRLGYVVAQSFLRFRCAIMLYTQGACAFTSVEPSEKVRKEGVYYTTASIPPHLLAEGEYRIGVSIFSSRGAKAHLAQVRDAVAFQVFDPLTGESARGDYAENLLGVVRPRLGWATTRDGEVAGTDAASAEA